MLLVAEHQTRGRGRMGRVWHATRGASLTMSLALTYRPQDWSGLSLAVGCALADALDPPTSNVPRIGLKWPNDLWLMDGGLAGPGRKLGGILIETVAAGAQRMCVVGVGLNVRPIDIEALGIGAGPGAGLSHGLASLSELDANVSVPGILHSVAVPLAQALLSFEQSTFTAFQAGFLRRDLLAGRTVSTSLPGWARATACGVDGRGALQVRGPDGQVQGVGSGEIQLLPNPLEVVA